MLLAAAALRAWQKPNHPLHHIVTAAGFVMVVLGGVLIQTVSASGAAAVLLCLLLTFGALAIAISFLSQKMFT